MRRKKQCPKKGRQRAEKDSLPQKKTAPPVFFIPNKQKKFFSEKSMKKAFIRSAEYFPHIKTGQTSQKGKLSCSVLFDVFLTLRDAFR